jgi:hypothetical protein
MVDLAERTAVERDDRVPVVLYPPGHEDAGKQVPHLDPVARALPSGPTGSGSSGPRVNGSREAPVPIRVDAVDLAADARVLNLVPRREAEGRMLPCRRCRSYHRSGSYLPQREQRAGVVDQAGELSVATVLDGWVRDWREFRHRGEGLPDPSVPRLCRWLSDRLEWACDDHAAIGDFAEELHGVRNALYSALGLFDIPDYKRGVVCRNPQCDALNLVQRSGSKYIECLSCGRLLSEAEFGEWTQTLAGGLRAMGTRARGGAA